MAYTTTEELKINNFWNKVIKTENCWIYPNKNKLGYGAVYMGGGKKRGIKEGAHRLAYRLIKGEIPSGLHLDHLCRNRTCVNPSHLEPVTPKTNTLRGEGPAAVNAKKVLCIRGHNRWGNQKKGRRCLECHRLKESGEI